MLWGMFRVNRSQLTLMSFILDHCFLSLILTTTSGASFCRCRNTPSRNSWTLEVWLLTPKNALQNLPWQVTSSVPRSITYSDVVRIADSTWQKSKVPKYKDIIRYRCLKPIICKTLIRFCTLSDFRCQHSQVQGIQYQGSNQNRMHWLYWYLVQAISTCNNLLGPF